MEAMKHWTSRSTRDFVYRVASDYVAQLETKLEEKNMGRRAYAARLGVTPGRVSQVLNDPENFNLTSIVYYARTLGMKVAIVAYDDEDPGNQSGPVSSQVFTTCWQRAGKPKDLFEATASTSGIIYAVATGNSPIIITQPTFALGTVVWRKDFSLDDDVAENKRYKAVAHSETIAKTSTSELLNIH